jgi:hypothetical protein
MTRKYYLTGSNMTGRKYSFWIERKTSALSILSVLQRNTHFWYGIVCIHPSDEFYSDEGTKNPYSLKASAAICSSLTLIMPVDSSQPLPFSETLWTEHLNNPLPDAHNQANWRTGHICILWKAGWGRFIFMNCGWNVETAKQRTWVLSVTLAAGEADIAEFQKYDEANLVEKVLKSKQLLSARMQRQPSRKWRRILS